MCLIGPMTEATSWVEPVRGDRLRVRADHPAGTGWLAIVPLPTEVFWIEQSSLENHDVPVSGRGGA